MRELELHIDNRHIIVNLPGTRLTITYRVSSQGLVEHPLWTGEDRKAPISLHEFRRSAWQAANKRACEIGWISADTSEDNPLPPGDCGRTSAKDVPEGWTRSVSSS